MPKLFCQDFTRAHTFRRKIPRRQRPFAAITSVVTLNATANTEMPAAFRDLLAALPTDPSWGPPTSTETTLDGVPYAPYSKGDKLGRMADWTTEGKDRDRPNRQQYGNRFRGTHCSYLMILYPI